jgi:hypothetical protein
MSALVLLPGEGKAVQIGRAGLGVVFKLFGTDTGGRFAVVEHPLAPGTLGGPFHIHHNAELVTSRGPPDIPRLMTLAQKYDLELDMSSLMELSQKYHVSLGGPGQPT